MSIVEVHDIVVVTFGKTFRHGFVWSVVEIVRYFFEN